MQNWSGGVCLVTGASKGIGRGIALQLGKAGATVYVTGRTKSDLESCCAELNEAGGTGIPVVVDHGKDSDVAGLYGQIGREQQGKPDVRGNKAYDSVSFLPNHPGHPSKGLTRPHSWESRTGILYTTGVKGLYKKGICCSLSL